MADIFNVALSGLNAAQQGMAVTGHNIANLNTPGYSRQTVWQTTREAQGTGAGFFGSGANINAIMRSYDAMVQQQLRGALSEHSRLDAFMTFGLRLDGLNADAEMGLAGSMERFFNAMQSVASSPSDSTTRELLLSEGQALVGKVHMLSGQLAMMERDVNLRLEASVTSINSLADSLADINDRITYAFGAFSQPPNDLLDQRDHLLNELSKLVNVSTAAQSDGSVNVYVGQGQALVLGNTVSRMGVVNDPYEPGRLEIVFEAGSTQIPITRQLTGGEIGGLLDVRRTLIDPAKLALGRTVTALVHSVNQQHQLGMDLRGELGGLFFGELEPMVARGADNTSAAEVALEIADWQALEAADYTLSFNGTDWTLTNATTGEVVPMTGDGTAADPFMARGMSFVVSGAADAGDRFRLSPVSGAADQFRMELHDVGGIAAANPIRVEPGAGNGGTGLATIGAIDPSDPDLQDGVQIEFLSPTSYSVDGGPPQTWALGDAIEVNGWRLEIAGQPVAGDTFDIESNVGAVGDNGNMLAMDALRGQRLLDGGTTTIAGGFQNSVARTAVLTQQSVTAYETQNVMLTHSMGERERLAGVNLDEEAARLIQLQHAYQASAQVIAVASSLFDTLLAATSRR